MMGLSDQDFSYVKQMFTKMSVHYGCIVSRPTNQSIPDTTDTIVDFTANATIELNDDDIFSAGSPTYLTLRKSGLYVATAWARFDADNTGNRRVWLDIDGAKLGEMTTAATATTHAFCAAIFLATEGNLLRMYVRQSSGGALNLTVARLGLARL